MKTKSLNKILHVVDFSYPVIMIDSDVCILRDIESLIGPHYDIQVTTISDIMKTSDDSSFLQTAILLKN
jgi:hypothetical protein